MNPIINHENKDLVESTNLSNEKENNLLSNNSNIENKKDETNTTNESEIFKSSRVENVQKNEEINENHKDIIQKEKEIEEEGNQEELKKNVDHNIETNNNQDNGSVDIQEETINVLKEEKNQNENNDQENTNKITKQSVTNQENSNNTPEDPEVIEENSDKINKEQKLNQENSDKIPVDVKESEIIQENFNNTHEKKETFQENSDKIPEKINETENIQENEPTENVQENLETENVQENLEAENVQENKETKNVQEKKEPENVQEKKEPEQIPVKENIPSPSEDFNKNTNTTNKPETLTHEGLDAKIREIENIKLLGNNCFREKNLIKAKSFYEEGIKIAREEVKKVKIFAINNPINSQFDPKIEILMKGNFINDLKRDLWKNIGTVHLRDENFTLCLAADLKAPEQLRDVTILNTHENLIGFVKNISRNLFKNKKVELNIPKQFTKQIYQMDIKFYQFISDNYKQIKDSLNPKDKTKENKENKEIPKEVPVQSSEDKNTKDKENKPEEKISKKINTNNIYLKWIFGFGLTSLCGFGMLYLLFKKRF